MQIQSFKLIVGLLLLILITRNSISQPRTTDIDTFLRTVVFINEPKVKTEKINGKEYEIFIRDKKSKIIEPLIDNHTGTAFFVTKDLDLYLVTAQHVASFTSENTHIVFTDQNDIPIQIPLSVLIDSMSNRINWTHHPHADVSALRIDLSKTPMHIRITPIPIQLVYNELEPPQRNVEITAYGYPLNYPLMISPKSKFSCVTKSYRPSSGLIDMPRFDTKTISTFFLVDDPSVSGLSGAPVIALPHRISDRLKEVNVNTSWLVGLVHGTISNNTGGYGAITPSKFIFETIDLAPGFNGYYFRHYENGIVVKNEPKN